MLPTRFARAARLTGLAAMLWAGALLIGSAAGQPLPQDGPDQFRALLDPKHEPTVAGAEDVGALVDYRARLNTAADNLPSLGNVAQVLLLPEWGSAEFSDLEPTVPVEKVEAVARQRGTEAFRSAAEKLLKESGANAGDAGRALVAEVRRGVRVKLLDRLETRSRYYLRQGRPVDRIAAANLIGDIMGRSRRQATEASELARGLDIRMPRPGLGPRYLGQRLQTLTADLRALATDGDSQVRAAAVRALTELEMDPAVPVVADLRKLLDAGRYDTTTRRAAAEAIGHLIDIAAQQADRGRPQGIVRGMRRTFPAAVAGLADPDTGVRRSSLTACRRAANFLDLLVPTRPDADTLVVFRPMRPVVEDAMTELSRTARGPVPDLRVEACQVLETLVLVAQRLGQAGEEALPPPTEPAPVPAAPEKKPAPADKPADKPAPARPERRDEGPGLMLAPRAPQRPAARRAVSWASDYSPNAPEPPPAATLQRPVKLSEAPAGVRPVAFVQAPGDELPPPTRVAPPAEAPAKVRPGLEGALDTAVAGLRDRDYRVRLASADVLESFGDQAAPAIPDLVRALGDSNKFVRWAVARSLGRLAVRAQQRNEADAVVRGLVARLNDREDPSVRIACAFALEQYGPAAKAAVPHLAHVINRGDKEYIIAVLHAIQGIGADAAPALPNVAWLLRQRQQPKSVRVEAARALGRFGKLAADQLDTLRDVMINDPDEDVRSAASNAILAIDRPAK